MIPTDQPPAVHNEQVLARQLSTAQQMAMALGGAIGTGLFLASGLAVNVAGPAIILSLSDRGRPLAAPRTRAAEMAVAHPTAGAFGVYAGIRAAVGQLRWQAIPHSSGNLSNGASDQDFRSSSKSSS
ncbi:MAG TPA: hypothetical protein VGG03_16015 [Thermoanaerobaculia bacterium]|jgi:L-asparagine transporter-like permease